MPLIHPALRLHVIVYSDYCTTLLYRVNICFFVYTVGEMPIVAQTFIFTINTHARPSHVMVEWSIWKPSGHLQTNVPGRLTHFIRERVQLWRSSAHSSTSECSNNNIEQVFDSHRLSLPKAVDGRCGRQCFVHCFVLHLFMETSE